MTGMRRGGLLRATLILFTSRLAFSLVASYPLARNIVAGGAALRPEGDASLFAPGGFFLLETLGLERAELLRSATTAAEMSLLLAVIGLLPLALAMACLERPDRWTDLMPSAARSFPRFVLVGGVTLLSQAALCALVAALRGLIGAHPHSVDERVPALMGGAALLLCGLLVILLGLLQDLTRAAVVRDPAASLAMTVRTAAAAYRRRPGSVIVGWAIPALSQLVLVVFAMRVVGQLDVSRPGGARVLGTFLVHQGVILASCGLRAVWLRRSLGLVPLAATQAPAAPSDAPRPALPG